MGEKALQPSADLAEEGVERLLENGQLRLQDRQPRDQSGGVVEQFSLPAYDWAQSMPLSRFRLDGSSLYELGSTSSGVFVDRYLGVS